MDGWIILYYRWLNGSLLDMCLLDFCMFKVVIHSLSLTVMVDSGPLSHSPLAELSAPRYSMWTCEFLKCISFPQGDSLPTFTVSWTPRHFSNSYYSAMWCMGTQLSFEKNVVLNPAHNSRLVVNFYLNWVGLIVLVHRCPMSAHLSKEDIKSSSSILTQSCFMCKQRANRRRTNDDMTKGEQTNPAAEQRSAFIQERSPASHTQAQHSRQHNLKVSRVWFIYINDSWNDPLHMVRPLVWGGCIWFWYFSLFFLTPVGVPHTADVILFISVHPL